MGTVVMVLYFLPVITGAIADRIGFKRTLIIAYTILSSGYLAMGFLTSYASVFLIFLYIAVGAAFFKPIVVATVSKTTTEENSSIGFGLFYMIVNIGALIGPIFASEMRESKWIYVFYMSSAIILLNLIIAIFFYKEPEREEIKEPLGETILNIFKNIGSALSDFKFVLLLIIIIGFWTMYNQFFYTLPVFIEQWMNLHIVYDFFHSFWPWFAENYGTSDGIILPEKLINFDAFFIVLFQLIISSLIVKFKPLSTMMVGFLICSVGISLTFATQNSLFVILAILIFGIGEMSSSPRIQEYIGIIAPKDKTALYMGCSYLPFAAGSFFAGIIAGDVYEKMSNKISLLQLEIEKQGLKIPEISDSFSQNDYYAKAEELLGMNHVELTNFLWNTYQPNKIWYLIFAIGIVSAIALFLYDRILFKNK
jgi:proton-dependent oligopeptide transporter, POT family